MLTISMRNSLLTGIISITVPVEKLQWMFDFNVNETEQTIKYLPGFLAAAFLTGRDGTRLFEYVQWASFEHFQAAVKQPFFADHIHQIRAVGVDDTDLYEVYYVDQHAALPTHQASITISLAPEPVTIITHFKTTREQQQALLDVLVEDHERSLRHLPGFVAVSLQRALSGEKVVEYLQFRSIEEFKAAQAHPTSKAHQITCKQYATLDLDVYTVGSIIQSSPASIIENG